MLVGQGANGLAGDHERVGADGQLPALGGDHLTGYPDVITEVDVLPPVLQHLGSNGVESDHHLQVAGAVAQSGETEFAAIPTEDDSASH